MQKGTGKFARTLLSAVCVLCLFFPIGMGSARGCGKSLPHLPAFRVILLRDVHILAGSPIAKEEFNMLYYSLVGDVDDLIFQDGWQISDR